ncbi:uncharacterized protein Triagg1_7864 [Trichoderma aggressivum f. europaeum]|uniref:Uncharacterized protein n=1 Tax=Trichoderma aggressivum f. europaeum TaxID=173218 RepID=A0AAE1I8R5_9HYPO|nr:hypothetical protein Triagg1_7864 [Trichoderma aggressivum f. europaeum]
MNIIVAATLPAPTTPPILAASFSTDKIEIKLPLRDDTPALHIPLWTTPGWKDDPDARNGTDFAVRDHVKDVIRPMMLDTDRAKNPTKYAVRFGIFPGRSDGRSCTSPTRSAERLMATRDDPGGSLTGRDLTSTLERPAQRRGLHIDDYIAAQSSNTMPNDGPQERDYTKAFDELLIEEFWQGCLFGDMTMDEGSGNYFEIGDFQSNLSGPIDSLFSREKWDQSPLGVADVGTVSFRLDGKCLDMEVEYKIPETAEANPQKAKSPNFKIELRRDNSEAIGYRHKIRPSAKFNPMELTFKVLESRLKWRIASAHYDVESTIGKFDAETAFAVTRFNLSNPNSSICIDLAAEVIWQLLAVQLSSSEKIMVSWMLAATMVHELCRPIIQTLNHIMETIREKKLGKLLKDIIFQKFFTQEFWDTTFKKYGSAALRSVPDIPQRVAWFSAVESTSFHTSLGDLALGTDEFREWVSCFILELEASGQKVIAQYIKALIYDAWKFPMLAKRFVEIAENWYHRGERLAAQASKTNMIAFEAGIFILQWRRLRSHKRIEPDETSISLDEMSVDQFISAITRGENIYDDQAMVAQLYELPIGCWEHYLEGIPGHQLIWRVQNNKIITQVTRLPGDLNGLQAHLPSWRNEWQAKILSWLTSFRNISYLISKDARAVHANWREMLHTVPMLRKSKRRGDQLAKLEEFKQRYARDFDLNSYKIVLPSRNSKTQGVAEKWAGLLDNIVEFEQDEGKLMEDLEREELHALISTPDAANPATALDPKLIGDCRSRHLHQAMEADKRDETRLRLQRADSYRQGVDKKLASTSISRRYQLQEAKHFNKTHSDLKLWKQEKRNWDLYTTGFDILGGPVPKKRSTDSIQKISSLSELMAEVNKDTNHNVYLPAGRIPQPMPRVIQISGDVLSELADSVQRDMDMMDIDGEVFKMQQARETFASEIQKTMKGHKETLSKAREHRVAAHELAQQERDKAAEMQQGGGE